MDSSRPTHIRLREAHAHLFQHGRSLGMVQLAGCRSAEELLEAMASDRRAGSGVLGQGARPESWTSPRWPSLEEFDRVTGALPSVAWCFDYHALMANSAALQAAGFSNTSADPPGGVLGRDERGRLNGVVYEKAALMVWDAIPEPQGERRLDLLRAALRDLASHGFVEVHDLKAQPWLPDALRALMPDHLHSIDLVLWPLMEHLDALAGSRSTWTNDHLKLGGGKIFVDGTLNSRTAWMLAPYADGPPAHPAGLALVDVEAIAQAIEKADRFGLPIAAHAIGDGAVRAVLDAIELVRPSARGYRIEHAELIAEDDLERIIRLRNEVGLIISVQPCHLLSDIEALSRAVPDRLDRVLPLRSLLDAGLVAGRDLVFGSDVPIVRPHPQDSIRAAVYRGREDSIAIAPEQAISTDEAWACFDA